MCENCSGTINRYDQYRKLCAATNREITSEATSDDSSADEWYGWMDGSNGDVSENVLPNRWPFSEPLVICVTDDETDWENDDSEAQAAVVSEHRITNGKLVTLTAVAAAKRRKKSRRKGAANTIRESLPTASPSPVTDRIRKDLTRTYH